MHFQFNTVTISIGILVLSTPAIAIDGVLDEGLEFSCFGLGCQRKGEHTEYNSSVPCGAFDEGDVFPNKEDCHSFYLCTDNRALKLHCPPNYGFDVEYQFCIPEYRVKACRVVYCPEYIFDGVVPDTKNCQAYYRCLYGFVYHYRCPKGSVFDPDRGICRHYTIGNEPDCLKEPTPTPIPPPTTTTTTPLPPTTTSATTVTQTTAEPVITSSSAPDTPEMTSTTTQETTISSENPLPTSTLEPVTSSSAPDTPEMTSTTAQETTSSENPLPTSTLEPVTSPSSEAPETTPAVELTTTLAPTDSTDSTPTESNTSEVGTGTTPNMGGTTEGPSNSSMPAETTPAPSPED